jgi:hypothetical protein
MYEEKEVLLTIRLNLTFTAEAVNACETKKK